MKYLLLLLSFLLLAAFGFAQNKDNFPPPDKAIEIWAAKANSPIKIDGKLDESDWDNAPLIKDFFRREPRQGGKLNYPTQVQILFDDKNIYVGAFCADSIGLSGIRVQDLRRDFSWGENDIFGIALDPQNLRQYAQVFQTTPYGNQRDMQNFNGNVYDPGWNTLWRVKTQRTEEGFFAEFSIPFKSLRYDLPEDGEELEWGLTMIRYARREVEVSSFPAIPQAFTPYRMTYAAKLRGIKAPPPSASVRVEPYGLYQYERTKIDGEVSSLDDFKVGGDIKWALNPRTVMDLTFNTDFAQANLDRAVNNLERFNIFFPEQRQFFLENSGIWAGGLQQSIRPFFSRRIGLQGAFNARPAPIDVGTRFTQRTEKQALAGLYVRQGETDNSAVSNFGVLRYLRNYGRENNVGVMLTHRADGENADLQLASNQNTTLTLDGQIRPSSEWDIQYLFSASFDEESGETGLAGRIFGGRSTNKYYAGWVTEYTDENYNPRMGFVRQNNVIRHNPGGYLIIRPKKMSWIRRWDPGIFANFNHDAADPSRFQQASLYIFPLFLWFKDNSFLEASFTPTWQNINFDFAPLGVPIARDRYFYTRYLIQYNTDLSKKWSADLGYDFGQFYNGRRNSIEAAARFAPIPHIALSVNYEYNDIDGLGTDNQDLETHLTTIGARFAMNPTLQLSSFYQYNSLDKQGRWNVRLSWEYQPLSFLYLVFNETQINQLDTPFLNQQFISKLTYIRQF